MLTNYAFKTILFVNNNNCVKEPMQVFINLFKN